MKKFMLAAVFFFCFSIALAQPADWYISISTGAGLSGPKGSIKRGFEKRGYNQTSTSNFLGWESTTRYPDVEMGMPVMVRAGKKVKGAKSIYMMVGTTGPIKVTGYKHQGYGSFLGLFGGSYGQTYTIEYNIKQLAVGVEHVVKNNRIKLGYAAAAYWLRYHNWYGVDKGKKTAMVPGAAFTSRVPLGRAKKRIGIELVADIHLAPPVTIVAQELSTVDIDFNAKIITVMPPTKVSMVHGNAGVAITLRHK